jgi:hypothetical protein
MSKSKFQIKSKVQNPNIFKILDLGFDLTFELGVLGFRD